jgi:secretion/DNA translocation related TadE-like protein
MSERQRGSATVWALGVIAIVVAVTAAGLGVGIVMLARHRAAAAADEMALAVAGHALDGGTVACSVGAGVAQLDGASAVACSLTDAIATVRVEVTLPGPLRHLGPAAAVARAGPASVRR